MKCSRFTLQLSTIRGEDHDKHLCLTALNRLYQFAAWTQSNFMPRFLTSFKNNECPLKATFYSFIHSWFIYLSTTLCCLITCTASFTIVAIFVDITSVIPKTDFLKLIQSVLSNAVAMTFPIFLEGVSIYRTFLPARKPWWWNIRNKDMKYGVRGHV